MAGSLIELYRQSFSETSVVNIVHSLGRDDLFCRIIIDGSVRNDCIKDLELDSVEPLNGFILTLTGDHSGIIQVMHPSAIPVNRISATKLVSVVSLISTNAQHTFGAYDAHGDQTFTGAAITVNLDATSANTNPSVFNLSSDIVTITKSGTYIATFSCSIEPKKKDDRSLSLVFIERDSGDGFEEIPGTKTYVNSSSKESGKSTGTASLPISVLSGDKFRLRAQRIRGRQSVKTLKNASRLSFEFKA